jgi:hypothetical protein
MYCLLFKLKKGEPGLYALEGPFALDYLALPQKLLFEV